MGWIAGICVLVWEGTFLFTTRFRLPLGPTLPPTKWILDNVSIRAGKPECELTTSNYPEQVFFKRNKYHMEHLNKI
jgi:hypothetical protein